MKRRPDPTPEVARARRYAARVRIAVALIGGAILVVEPSAALHPPAAAVGLIREARPLELGGLDALFG